MSTHFKKLGYILFPPSKFPSTSIHPDYPCSTNKSIRNHKRPLNKNIDNGDMNYSTRNTKTWQQEAKENETQPRRSTSSSISTKVGQEHKSITDSQVTAKCSTILTQKSCPTLIESSGQDEACEGFPPSKRVEDTADSASIHYQHQHHHHHHRDKREISSALKRCMLPFKIHYELEWPIPSDSVQNTKKTWLQLDEQTSNGIERVRKLGFSDLDVRLNDDLTRYINSLIDGQDQTAQDVVIQVIFDPNSPVVDDTKQNVRLLRLRRVYWWSTSYNVARSSLPVH